eukprot:792526-Rhodomonas_salina.1
MLPGELRWLSVTVQCSGLKQGHCEQMACPGRDRSDRLNSWRVPKRSGPRGEGSRSRTACEIGDGMQSLGNAAAEIGTWKLTLRCNC